MFTHSILKHFLLFTSYYYELQYLLITIYNHHFLVLPSDFALHSLQQLTYSLFGRWSITSTCNHLARNCVCVSELKRTQDQVYTQMQDWVNTLAPGVKRKIFQHFGMMPQKPDDPQLLLDGPDWYYWHCVMPCDLI